MKTMLGLAFLLTCSVASAQFGLCDFTCDPSASCFQCHSTDAVIQKCDPGRPCIACGGDCSRVQEPETEQIAAIKTYLQWKNARRLTPTGQVWQRVARLMPSPVPVHRTLAIMNSDLHGNANPKACKMKVPDLAFLAKFGVVEFK